MISVLFLRDDSNGHVYGGLGRIHPFAWVSLDVFHGCIHEWLGRIRVFKTIVFDTS